MKPPTQLLILILVSALPCFAGEVDAPQASRGLRTVILDPGHGGDDLGVTGTSGLSERDIAADVCRRISRIISERLGTPRVVLTHERDAGPDPAARTSLANGRKGDLLLSVHVAGTPTTASTGGRVWIMSPGWRVVELSERRLPRGRGLVTGLSAPGTDTDLRLTPWAMAQQEFAPRSRALAESLARQLAEVAGNAPVGEMPLAVLAGARMPAALVEIGFLSGPEEERLGSDRYREAIAEALYRGIERFAGPALPPTEPGNGGE